MSVDNDSHRAFTGKTMEGKVFLGSNPGMTLSKMWAKGEHLLIHLIGLQGTRARFWDSGVSVGAPVLSVLTVTVL